MSRLLIVDDEQSICWGLSRLGAELGHEVQTASSVEEAVRIAADFQPEVIALDVRLPGVDGLSGMPLLREAAGPVPIIVMTAHGDLNTAVDAVRQGAFEYLVKPFDLKEMERLLRLALDSTLQPTEEVPAVEGFVGGTPVMQNVFNRIALAARSDANVLLQGDSGTGKELAARAIHRFSSRSEGPLVVVHTAALTPSLAESELFGHEKGAFTGADTARQGLLRQAHGGTLFLDEVADMPMSLQIKLLRSIEQREVLAVGSSIPVPADFRIVAATHRNLLSLVERGEFRHDLYFRLATFHIELPPLRERRDDIIPLANYCLAQLTDNPVALPERTCDELLRRDWHGNVRELRNAIQHGLIMSRGAGILPEHLPPPAPASVFQGEVAEGEEAPQLQELLRRWAARQLDDASQDGRIYEALLELVEPAVLQTVMQRHGGQLAASARALGLHRTTLKKKLDRAGDEQDP